ncbi:MAG: DUF521 domain-containing protein [Firmicutes bacterium]|nr:DUF521 domain-containing protein [Bacillota bacterium]
MKLTYEELKLLNGDYGQDKQEAMEFLIKYGKKAKAEKMLKVSNIKGKVGGFNCSSNINKKFKYSCTPYLIGRIPVYKEHCAWMNSSAVGFCNSVIGARTNTETIETIEAISLVNRIPFYGLHIKENRYATYEIDVDTNINSNKEFGVLGYFIGNEVENEIPVIKGINSTLDLMKFKHINSAITFSGGIELFHIVGKTPEANTLKEALGNNKAKDIINFGNKEKKEFYDLLNTSKDEQIDLVVLGCPNVNLEEIWEIRNYLHDKVINSRILLYIYLPRYIKYLADESGCTEVIEKAGGYFLVDNCPLYSVSKLTNIKVVATNSSRQANYLSQFFNKQVWYGSTKECIEAAISGIWRGEGI